MQMAAKEVDSTSEGEQTCDAVDSTSEVEQTTSPPSPSQTDLSEKGPSKEEKEALDQYLKKFGENRAGENPGYNRQAFPWTAGKPLKTTPKEAIEAVLLANQPKKDRLTKGHIAFLLFSPMRSEGSRFTLGVWGQGCVRQMLRLRSQPSATVRNRPQPSTVRNRSQPFATVRMRAVRLSSCANPSGVVPKVCQVDS